MHRNALIATGVAGCVIALGACTVQGKAAPSAADGAGSASSAAASRPNGSSSSTQSAPAAVIQRARKALSEVGLSSDLKLLTSEGVQWNDSSLGCPQPGGMYTQVITSGYVVRFADQGSPREVHVAGDAAIVCSPQLGTGVPKRATPAYRARDLDAIVETARADLATRVGAKIEDIRLVNFEPTSWPDSRLGCGDAVPDAPSAAPVRGFRLFLATAQDSYVYHTDLRRAFPCPPIAAQ